MAASVLFTFSLCLLLCAALSKPVAHDSGSEQSSYSVDTVVIKMTIELARARDIELVRSLDSDSVVALSLSDDNKRLKRAKRATIVGGWCPQETIWYMNMCMPFEKYERFLEEE